jgi:hypothetical protein
VSVWEHLVMQVASVIADGLYPAGPARVEWHTASTGGIRVDFLVPLTRDAGLADVQPMYEQFALVLETRQTRVAQRDRESVACTGTSPRRAAPRSHRRPDPADLEVARTPPPPARQNPMSDPKLPAELAVTSA